jgi:predicted GNAT family acetyltransferase
MSDSSSEGTEQIQVVDDRAGSRYLAQWGDSVAGFAEYNLKPDAIVFTHTEVDPAFEGRGVAGVLVRAALDDVRSRGLRVIAVCPYVKAWLARHPDYQDLLLAKPASPAHD